VARSGYLLVANLIQYNVTLHTQLQVTGGQPYTVQRYTTHTQLQVRLHIYRSNYIQCSNVALWVTTGWLAMLNLALSVGGISRVNMWGYGEWAWVGLLLVQTQWAKWPPSELHMEIKCCCSESSGL